jgi:hypothetical protein
MIGIITKLNATPPAKAEKCLVLNTSITKTNSPKTIEGKPVNTSFMKPETIDSREEDHSEKKMPAPTPIGTEIRAAMPTMMNDPTIVLAIPPSGKVGPVGKWAKNPILMAGAPRMRTSPSMRIRGTTARTTVATTRIDINLLTNFRQGEIFVGSVAFFKIAVSSQIVVFAPRVILQSKSRANTLIINATKKSISPISIIADR